MKKSIVLSIVAVSCAFGGDYGYREHLMNVVKNHSSFGFISLDPTTTVYAGYTSAHGPALNYCLAQGGNLTQTITTDLGTEELRAITDEGMSRILGMSQEQRIDLIKKDKDIFNRGEGNKSFVETSLGNRISGTKANGKFECKTPSGQSIYTATLRSGSGKVEYWIVNHKPETLLDYNPHGRDSDIEGTSDDMKKKILAAYPTYEKYFDSWNNGFFSSDLKQKHNQTYRMTDSFTFDTEFWVGGSMKDLADVETFCEAQGGAFNKDGVSFKTFLKQFYLNGGHATDGMGSSPFIGHYSCSGSKEPFTVELDTYKALQQTTFMISYALIKKGEDATANAASKGNGFFTGGATAQMEQALQTPAKIQMIDAGNISQQDAGIITSAVSMRAPIGSQQGANAVTAFYNGKDSQGCDLVSLQKSVANMPNSSHIYNYKSCNGQISALGETNMPGVPRKKELDPIIAQVKDQCKVYGAYVSEYQGTTISCRTLDINHCNMEINIIQDGKLINKQVENTCK